MDSGERGGAVFGWSGELPWLGMGHDHRASRISTGGIA